MKLSSGLRISSGLEDFMAPSQECIKPVKINRMDTKEPIHLIEEEGTYHEVLSNGSRVRLEPTKISLTDCLACSGCVTTAEAVLVEEQGLTELYKHFGREDETVVVTLSQQSTASIAAHFDLNFEETFEKLTSFFRAFGVKFVFDLSVARHLSVLEAANEFIERKKRATEGLETHLPMLIGACPGWVCYAEKTQSDYILPYLSTTKSPQQIMGSLIKDPFARSIGVHPAKIYHVCIMPCFDKKLEASRVDFKNESEGYSDVDIVISSLEVLEMIETHTNKEFNTTISTRANFSTPEPPSGSSVTNSSGSRSSDDEFQRGLYVAANFNPNTQLSPRPRRNSAHSINAGLYISEKFNPKTPAHSLSGTIEIEAITEGTLEENKAVMAGYHFKQLPKTRSTSELAKSMRHFSEEGRPSGGYLEFIFRKAAQELFGSEVKEIKYKKGRNEDRVDANFVLNDDTVLRFGIVYGFRNIQNVVRMIKTKKCQYDFIEIMACPGGCTNGGGQIRSDDSMSHLGVEETVNSNTSLKKVNEVYFQTTLEKPEDNVTVQQLTQGWLATPEKREELLHTKYHSIPKVEVTHPLAIKW